MSIVDNSRLFGPSAIVSGGSRGVGAAVAVELAKRGYDLVVTYQRDTASAQRVRRAVRESGREALTLQVDLADHKSVVALLSRLASVGPPSVLVNCAGQLSRRSLSDTSAHDMEHSFAVNCLAPFRLARELAPRMPSGSSIVNVGSVLGLLGSKNRVAYSASKAALVGLTKALACELAPSTRVNAVAPGVLATDMTASLASDSAARNGVTSRIPLARLGTAQECADVITFLACDATYVTGAVWEVDGGLLGRLAVSAADPGA